MMTITLNNGLEFEGTIGWVADPDHLVISSTVDEIKKVFFALIDPEATKEMTFKFGGYKNIYRGYTKFGHSEFKPGEQSFLVWMEGNGDTSRELDIPTVPVEYLPKDR